jgi:ABC-type multidrug transport system permease subunit
MKIFDVAHKSLKENIRNGWVMLLTLLAAPFFITVFYLISNTYDYNYKVAVMSNDQGIFNKNKIGPVNHIDSLAGYLSFFNEKLNVQKVTSKQTAIKDIKENELDVIIKLPDNFSAAIEGLRYSQDFQISIHFMGDISGNQYLNCAVWLYEGIESYIEEITSIRGPVVFTEEGVGHTAQFTDFDYQIPGLFIFAIIMILYSAGISFVTEKENKTMQRLGLTYLKNREYILGLSLVQLLISFLSIIFSFMVAMQLGFDHHGSFTQITVISLITAISVISLSALIASFCTQSKQVIVIITITLFIFMIFTGVMFPIDTPLLFYWGEYPVYLNSLLSPSFAVRAMNNALVWNASFDDILPDLYGLVIITLIYMGFGSYFYKKSSRDTQRKAQL